MKEVIRIHGYIPGTPGLDLGPYGSVYFGFVVCTCMLSDEPLQGVFQCFEKMEWVHVSGTLWS